MGSKMNLSEQTVKCPICSSPYKFYAFTVADQSACPSCVRRAEGNTRPGTDFRDLSRESQQKYFGNK